MKSIHTTQTQSNTWIHLTKLRGPASGLGIMGCLGPGWITAPLNHEIEIDRLPTVETAPGSWEVSLITILSFFFLTSIWCPRHLKHLWGIEVNRVLIFLFSDLGWNSHTWSKCSHWDTYPSLSLVGFSQHSALIPTQPPWILWNLSIWF